MQRPNEITSNNCPTYKIRRQHLIAKAVVLEFNGKYKQGKAIK